MEKGTDIVVSFTEAKSIQPGKTKVYYRGVPIGMVKDIALSKDGKRAECVIELEKNATQFAVEGSVFYLVYPKVGFEGISGLETIISGSYIAIDPGSGKIKKEFNGELSRVSNEPEEGVSSYTLETDHAESLSVGDAIFFRGITVGTIEDTRLSPTAQSVLIKVNIKSKYSKLIRKNTSFWRKQGIKADLGLFGSKIKVNSLDTILKGGIEFATPNEEQPMAPVGTVFALQEDEPKNLKEWKPSLTFPKKSAKKAKK